MMAKMEYLMAQKPRYHVDAYYHGQMIGRDFDSEAAFNSFLKDADRKMDAAIRKQGQSAVVAEHELYIKACLDKMKAGTEVTMDDAMRWFEAVAGLLKLGVIENDNMNGWSRIMMQGRQIAFQNS